MEMITVRFPRSSRRNARLIKLEVPQVLHERIKYAGEQSRKSRWTIYQEACQACNEESARAVEHYMNWLHPRMPPPGGIPNVMPPFEPLPLPDLKEVDFPKHSARKKEMRKKIRELVAQGYTRFKTRIVRCLNQVESPDPDYPPPGFQGFGFWHDAPKKDWETGSYNDVLLFACK